MTTTERTISDKLAQAVDRLIGRTMGLTLGLAVITSLFVIGFRLKHVADPEPPSHPHDDASTDHEGTADAAVEGEPAVDEPTVEPLPMSRRARAVRLLKRLTGTAFNVSLVIAVVFAVFVAYGLVNNRWYHVLVVKGASMTPTISAGDLVVLGRPPAQIEPGMILTMEVDNSVVTHRVATVNADGSFTTKGDANSAGDDFSANAVRVVGQVLFRVPLVGSLLPAGNPPAVPASAAWFKAAASVGASADSGSWSTPPL